MEYYLVALIPSEDVVLKINELRSSLFRNFGIISSRALPIMIPALFCSSNIQKELFSNTKKYELTYTNKTEVTREGDIFLSIRDSLDLNEIREKISPCNNGLFIAANGFYLCTVKDNDILPEIRSHIASLIPDSVTWKKNSLELIKVTTEGEIWWENVRWETLWKMNITNRK